MPPQTAPPHDYVSMGLSPEEYEAIARGLGREPSRTELGMFAVLWSEHCSYKSSREVLKLFSEYRASVEGKGLENAGVLDIGDGVRIAFKVESHNHPSAVEPYEGAATGVGGIIRDILTMGARPIASLNSLRFGDIRKNAEDKRLFDRVVSGIGGYGNCIGVPTVAGEIYFHDRYSGNPLVNAMCVGRLETEKVATASAEGVGNPVLYLGSATGRDGIHGATFASEVLDEDNEAKRPNVQIGDPFAGKLLIEATLEALNTGAIVAIQDMGAAGLTCSTCEMSEKGGVGMDIDLDKAPLRDDTMSSYEIMLSESQERMLAVAKAGREAEVLDIFHKWGLPAAQIGTVTAEPIVTIRHKGKVEACVPADFISNGCPAIRLEAKEPPNAAAARNFSLEGIQEGKNFGDALLRLMSEPSLASKRWIYEQYDYTVQTQTRVVPGAADAAVLALRGTKKGISTKIDGNGRWTFADPYVGGQLALTEAARNVACTGARPLAATDCLNFGNPNDPHVYFQFSEAVKGIADAAEQLHIPVLSGNVSFYNETELGEVLPTPAIGVVGVLEDASNSLTMQFPQGRGYLYLISGQENPAAQHGLGASEYLRVIHGIEDGAPQAPVLRTEKALINFLVAAASEKAIDAAHDVSEGGLAFAIAEMCAVSNAGGYILVDSGEHYVRHVLGPLMERLVENKQNIANSAAASILEAQASSGPWAFSSRMDAKLFGEMPGRVLAAVGSEKLKNNGAENLFRLAAEHGLDVHCLGTFDSSISYLQFMTDSESLLKVRLSEIADAYNGAIPRTMNDR